MRSARENDRLVRYFRSTVIPDESVTATIVGNRPELDLAPIGLHYVRWSRADSGHPDTFEERDLEELSNCSAPFARKFDVDRDEAILDRLDELLASD